MLPASMVNIDAMSSANLRRTCTRHLRTSVPLTFFHRRLGALDSLPETVRGALHRLVVLAAIAAAARDTAASADRGGRAVAATRAAAAETEMRLLACDFEGRADVGSAYAFFLLAHAFLPADTRLSRHYASVAMQRTSDLVWEWRDGGSVLDSQAVLVDVLNLHSGACLVLLGMLFETESSPRLLARSAWPTFDDARPLMSGDTAAYVRLLESTHRARAAVRAAVVAQYRACGSLDPTSLRETLRREDAEAACTTLDAVVSMTPVDLAGLAAADAGDVADGSFGTVVLVASLLAVRGAAEFALGRDEDARRTAGLIHDSCVRHVEAAARLEPHIIELLHFVVCASCRFDDDVPRARRCMQLLSWTATEFAAAAAAVEAGATLVKEACRRCGAEEALAFEGPPPDDGELALGLFNPFDAAPMTPWEELLSINAPAVYDYLELE